MTTDDSFQPTPHDIRGHEFPRAFRGYEPARVESFQPRVSEEFDRVLRERTDVGKRQFAAFLANFRALLERQLGEVEGLQASAQAAAQSQTELVLKKQA